MTRVEIESSLLALVTSSQSTVRVCLIPNKSYQSEPGTKKLTTFSATGELKKQPFVMSHAVTYFCNESCCYIL